MGALVEAALIIWLVGGFLPAGLLTILVTIVLGGLIYRDIAQREKGSRPSPRMTLPDGPTRHRSAGSPPQVAKST